MSIKIELERHGVPVFVAHRDIVPASEWRDEIQRQISDCDLLVALLTANYKQSVWTDQECGMAIAEGKVVLPLAIELMPYGFMEQFQALTWKRLEYRASMREFLSVVLSRLNVPSEGLVKGFETTPTFDDAGHGLKLIMGRSGLTKDQINRVARASVENRQIYDAGSATTGLVEFFKIHDKDIDLDIKVERARILGRQ